mgnify:CR=1 FL=1
MLEDIKKDAADRMAKCVSQTEADDMARTCIVRNRQIKIKA